MALLSEVLGERLRDAARREQLRKSLPAPGTDNSQACSALQVCCSAHATTLPSRHQDVARAAWLLGWILRCFVPDTYIFRPISSGVLQGLGSRSGIMFQAWVRLEQRNVYAFRCYRSFQTISQSWSCGQRPSALTASWQTFRRACTASRCESPPDRRFCLLLFCGFGISVMVFCIPLDYSLLNRLDGYVCMGTSVPLLGQPIACTTTAHQHKCAAAA